VHTAIHPCNRRYCYYFVQIKCCRYYRSVCIVIRRGCVPSRSCLSLWSVLFRFLVHCPVSPGKKKAARSMRMGKIVTNSSSPLNSSSPFQLVGRLSVEQRRSPQNATISVAVAVRHTTNRENDQGKTAYGGLLDRPRVPLTFRCSPYPMDVSLLHRRLLAVR